MLPDVKTDFSAVQNRPLNIFAEYYEAPDPAEGYNRVMSTFNDAIIGYVFKPIGKLYSFIIPEYGREGIARMADNIEMPGRLINSLLQARWERAGIELARFGVNTTLGVAGFWDFADDYMGMMPQTNSFGMTFAYWGIGPGCYIVLPIQGSTTLRDGIGLIFDWFADPITYIPPYGVWPNFYSWGIKFGIELNDMTLVIDEYSRIYESSRDPYMTFKDLYFAQRLIAMQDLKTNGLRDEYTDTNRHEDNIRHE
jgi:phospholipid-binding lipoprotein MlaA